MIPVSSCKRVGNGRLRTRAVVVIGLAIFLSSRPVAAADREVTQAYSTCIAQSNGVTAQMINCMLAETGRQDARLNENYKRLLSKLGTERMRWPGYCSGTSSSFASCSWESGAAMYLKETASAISGSMPSMRSGSTLFLG